MNLAGAGQIQVKQESGCFDLGSGLSGANTLLAQVES